VGCEASGKLPSRLLLPRKSLPYHSTPALCCQNTTAQGPLSRDSTPGTLLVCPQGGHRGLEALGVVALGVELLGLEPLGMESLGLESLGLESPLGMQPVGLVPLGFEALRVEELGVRAPPTAWAAASLPWTAGLQRPPAPRPWGAPWHVQHCLSAESSALPSLAPSGTSRPPKTSLYTNREVEKEPMHCQSTEAHLCRIRKRVGPLASADTCMIGCISLCECHPPYAMGCMYAGWMNVDYMGRGTPHAMLGVPGAYLNIPLKRRTLPRESLRGCCSSSSPQLQH